MHWITCINKICVCVCYREIVRSVKLLMEAYLKDVDLRLTVKLLHFHLYVRQNQRITEEHSLFVSHGDLYQNMCKAKIHTAFLNVEATFRLLMSLMATNCPGKKSFSRLKRTKNELRSIIFQESLSALSIFCIESDKLKQIIFKELILL